MSKHNYHLQLKMEDERSVKKKETFIMNSEYCKKSITYEQWIRVSEERLVKGKEKTVDFLIKDKRQCLMGDLLKV